MGCLHYTIGFEKPQERDNHVKSHYRPFKCPELGCFYGDVGFSNNRSLNQHISRCHTDLVSNKFIFPRLSYSSYPTEDEQRKFREAIESDDLDLVRDLIQKNSSLKGELRSASGYTGLQHAARYGNIRIAQLLLQYGSHIGAVNAYGSALSVACYWGQVDMVQFLLSKLSCKEDLDQKHPRGEMPLLISCAGAEDAGTQLAVLRLLLDDSRVAANGKDYDGRTLLSLVAGMTDSDKAQVLEMLLGHDRIGVDAKDNEGRTPLSWAASRGPAEAVKMFLQCDRGVNVNAKDNKGRTPLSWAASREKGSTSNAASVVKIMLEHHGIDADPKDSEGRTPLSRAANWGVDGVVEIFLQCGREVDVNSKDNEGRTPLSWAAGRGGGRRGQAVSVVKSLLEHHGIDADARDNWGRTPLSRAASTGMAVVVGVFLQYSWVIDVNAKDAGGRTPLSWAAAKTGYHLACSSAEQVVKEFLEHNGIDVDSRDSGGRTPLSWAAGEGMAGVVEMFLQRGRGVDVNAKDKEGRTPLSWAASRARGFVWSSPEISVAVVKILLTHDGTDVDARDNGGRTPLSWAASGGIVEVVEMFLQCDWVDVNAEDNGGRTPLSWAVARENGSKKAEVVQALIKHGGIGGSL